MNIAEIENILINKMRALGIFRVVDSMGRKDKPVSLSYPSAFVYFVSDSKMDIKPRPVYELIYEVIIINKNMQSEQKAAIDTYTIIDEVRDLVDGKTFGIDGIEPFSCESRELTDYTSGEISYTLKIRTVMYLPVPNEVF